MSEPDCDTAVTVHVETTTTTTWCFSADEVAKILRAHCGAGADAQVELDCGYNEFFRNATVTRIVREPGQ